MLRTKDIVLIGMLAGVCVVATFIKVPFGTGAMVHLGTAFIFTCASLFGGLYAGLAAAIGTAMFDLLMGFSPYTLWSFFIKGGAGFIAGYIIKGVYPWNIRYKNGLILKVMAYLTASIWALFGYILAWWQVIGSLNVALANVPASLMSSTVGIIVALFLVPVLERVLPKNLYK